MTTVYDEYKLIEDEIQKCMKCGNCQAVCPVFSVQKTEAGVARGKIALADAILKGKLDFEDPDMYDRVFNCLVCKSCMQNCPPQVNFDRIILALRSAIAKKKGLHPLKQTIFNLLFHKKPLFEKGLKTGARLQNLFTKTTDSGQGRNLRFSIGMLDRKRVIPSLTNTPFRDRVDEKIFNSDKPQTTVAFFTGCSINYIYPNIGDDIVNVLKNNNVNILIPKDQYCCGIPVFAHGDIETARLMAKANIDALQKTDADYVIFGCGSCAGTFTHEYLELLKGEGIYEDLAIKWKDRALEISQLLLKKIDFIKPKGEIKDTVTYHDSCHLRKTMKVWQEPREIIRSIPGITFKEMSKPDACCGSGGTYNLTHYETSLAILKNKIADINKTGASTVLTACPGCIIQLIDGVEKFGNRQIVKHYITLLSQSYK
ncbi:MAG: (Fe-S)-binding protein [Thermodesulfovibrionales bacterium]